MSELPERTICNPLNLSYRHQAVVPGKRAMHREAADPSVILFQGRYYLFASMSAGFWHSSDLVTWDYRATPRLPVADYAPDVREIAGDLVVCASRRRRPCSFYRTPDPLTQAFEEVEGSFAFWDPNLFQDDDGRVYLYWGCSNRTPLYGVELDRSTMAPRGERRELFGGNAAEHGWERTGESYDERRSGVLARVLGPDPFVEGAWMTKHDGTYYLQYAAPGTELNTYADGYYTSDAPLGPFTYSPHSPFSSKPGGFLTGAGHGSTFPDRHGNWWHVATMRVSVNHRFERRVGLFPAGFDDDGVLFCNQSFADYPMVVPDGRFDAWTESFPGWMLLSYRGRAQASSSRSGHGAELAVDEDVRTWWVPAADDGAPTLMVDLGDVCAVRAVQVNLADHEIELPRGSLRRSTFTALGLRSIDVSEQVSEYVVDASPDGASWTTLHDTRGSGTDLPHDFVVLDEPGRFRFVRVIGGTMPHGWSFAISGLRVFGRGNGEPPAPAQATASRVGPAMHASRGPSRPPPRATTCATG